MDILVGYYVTGSRLTSGWYKQWTRELGTQKSVEFYSFFNTHEFCIVVYFTPPPLNYGQPHRNHHLEYSYIPLPVRLDIF